jgi:hypothetical protein
VARDFGITHTTLQRHLIDEGQPGHIEKTALPSGAKIWQRGPKPALSLAEQVNVEEMMGKLQAAQIHTGAQQLRNAALEMHGPDSKAPVVSSSGPEIGKPVKFGRGWLQSFEARSRRLTKRKQLYTIPRDLDHALRQTPEQAQSFFRAADAAYEEMRKHLTRSVRKEDPVAGLRILMADELKVYTVKAGSRSRQKATAYRTGDRPTGAGVMGKTRQVLTLGADAKNQPKRTSMLVITEYPTGTTLLVAVVCEGTRRNMSLEQAVHAEYPTALIFYSASGFITDVAWLQVMRALDARLPAADQGQALRAILLMDEYQSHFFIFALTYALQHGIKPLGLPPRLTEYLSSNDAYTNAFIQREVRQMSSNEPAQDVETRVTHSLKAINRLPPQVNLASVAAVGLDFAHPDDMQNRRIAIDEELKEQAQAMAEVRHVQSVVKGDFQQFFEGMLPDRPSLLQTREMRSHFEGSVDCADPRILQFLYYLPATVTSVLRAAQDRSDMDHGKEEMKRFHALQADFSSSDDGGVLAEAQAPQQQVRAASVSDWEQGINALDEQIATLQAERKQLAGRLVHTREAEKIDRLHLVADIDPQKMGISDDDSFYACLALHKAGDPLKFGVFRALAAQSRRRAVSGRVRMSLSHLFEFPVASDEEVDEVASTFDLFVIILDDDGVVVHEANPKPRARPMVVIRRDARFVLAVDRTLLEFVVSDKWQPEYGPEIDLEAVQVHSPSCLDLQASRSRRGRRANTDVQQLRLQRFDGIPAPGGMVASIELLLDRDNKFECFHVLSIQPSGAESGGVSASAMED